MLRSTVLTIESPYGRTLFWTAICLAGILVVAELITRNAIFQAQLTAPDLDSRQYQMGRKLALLESSIEQWGTLDCLVLGSSAVDLGFDPAAFSSSFEELTGQPLHCFNFGMEGMPMAGTAAMAQVLVEDYGPRLLIVLTDARDFAVKRNEEDAIAVLETAWVQDRLGKFSLQGWFVEHSYLFRYRKILARIARLDLRDIGGAPLNYEISPNGQTRVATIGVNLDGPPAIHDDGFIVKYLTGIFSNYQLQSENLAGLETVIALQHERGRDVVLVEMPMPAGYFSFFGNGQADYDRFIETVHNTSKMAGVPLVPSMPLNELPEDGWVDYLHLNESGAEVFSRWLAKRIVDLVAEGRLALPVETTAVRDARE
jgi:hypothetical protein